jgi:hypothetical protein
LAQIDATAQLACRMTVSLLIIYAANCLDQGGGEGGGERIWTD